jgi:hypothetical protein
MIEIDMNGDMVVYTKRMCDMRTITPDAISIDDLFPNLSMNMPVNGERIAAMMSGMDMTRPAV